MQQVTVSAIGWSIGMQVILGENERVTKSIKCLTLFLLCAKRNFGKMLVETFSPGGY